MEQLWSSTCLPPMRLEFNSQGWCHEQALWQGIATCELAAPPPSPPPPPTRNSSGGLLFKIHKWSSLCQKYMYQFWISKILRNIHGSLLAACFYIIPTSKHSKCSLRQPNFTSGMVWSVCLIVHLAIMVYEPLYHALQIIKVPVRVCSKLKTSWKSVVFYYTQLISNTHLWKK